MSNKYNVKRTYVRDTIYTTIFESPVMGYRLTPEQTAMKVNKAKTTRALNKASLVKRNSFNITRATSKFLALAKANYDSRRTIFLGLTTDIGMDEQHLKEEFGLFIKRLTYACQKYDNNKKVSVPYMAVIERGYRKHKLHLHILLFNLPISTKTLKTTIFPDSHANEARIKLVKQMIEPIWGLGVVECEVIRDIDRLIFYLWKSWNEVPGDTKLYMSSHHLKKPKSYKSYIGLSYEELKKKFAKSDVEYDVKDKTIKNDYHWRIYYQKAVRRLPVNISGQAS